MRDLIGSLIEKMGEPMTLQNPDGTKTQLRAILLPLFSQGQDPAQAVTALGDCSRLRWRYIGPAGASLKDWKGLVLERQGEAFSFIWAKDYSFSRGRSHWEALVKRREAAYGQTG